MKMQPITDYEISQLPPPPQEWLDDIQDEIDFKYNQYIQSMSYEKKIQIIKKHMNINLPYKRQIKIIRDFIDIYESENQQYLNIYQKGSNLEYYAHWDSIPYDSAPFYGKATKKGLRTFFKKDMIKLLENNGLKEKQRFQSARLQNLDTSTPRVFLENDEERDMFLNKKLF